MDGKTLTVAERVTVIGEQTLKHYITVYVK